MKGFTLIEFVVATTFFLFILLAGYEAARVEKDLVSFAQARTMPEAEFNFRLLILKHLLEGSSDAFNADPMLETVPTFFADLNFGKAERPDAFSFAVMNGSPGRFQREGTLYRLDPFSNLKIGDMLMLAGVCYNGEYGWNYGRIIQVNGDHVELNFLLSSEPLEKGVWVKIQVNGFLFKQRTLYWISPAGQASPFLDPLEDFQYSWRAPQITISWRAGLTELE